MKQTAETIDKIPDEILAHVIRHSNDFSWKFLAMKIILTRLNLKLTMYQGDQSVLPDCCNELRNLLKRSTNVPNSQADMYQILSLTK